MNERPIPTAAQRDAASVEMLRVWVAEKQLHCSLKIGMYRDGMGVDEELVWGTILADAARHIARALHPENADEEQVALQKNSPWVKRGARRADLGSQRWVCIIDSVRPGTDIELATI